MTSYCCMCGSAIPDGQGVCSYCYGDPFFGEDGYYLESLLAFEQFEQAKQEHENFYIEKNKTKTNSLKFFVVGVNKEIVCLGTMLPVDKKLISFYMKKYPKSYIEI